MDDPSSTIELPADLHHRLAILAAKRGESVEVFVQEVLSRLVLQEGFGRLAEEEPDIDFAFEAQAEVVLRHSTPI